MRKRRPSVSPSLTKSRDQSWFGPSGIIIGARVPNVAKYSAVIPALCVAAHALNLQQVINQLFPALAGRA
jgi:hypothetical protein